MRPVTMRAAQRMIMGGMGRPTMRVMRRGVAHARCTLSLALLAAAASGCAATVKEIRHHPQQARLERLLEEVRPKTKYPHKHYWVRVADASKDRIGLAVLPQRHIYIAEPIVEQADDALLRAMLVHGVSHHRLHHYTQRHMADASQKAAFKAGGQFVPGLSNAGHVGGPVIEYLMGPPHEWSGDRKTRVYLTRMGVPPEEYVRALEFLAERDYAERIGRITSRPKHLTRRAAKLRRRLGLPAAPAASSADAAAPEASPAP